ncbi:MAG: ParB/RepB/Spo0J family partition protein [Candidatus Tectomicrobia bacterium]|uniref:ParB/RepB/Spo0J family partition protein n=1 Tax=Tectimicrobiota bacterium TaxID=2528274 RepID=A0A938B434_UNCTE|nr:ParB/RepB/Spo0J family partition protein [Candidatus Tectomicrobia bacterium]
MAREVLGRGLRALLEGTEAVGGSELLHLPVAQVQPNPYQPRQHFDMERLHELAESLKTQGLLQPVVVRRQHNTYELIAGERRWRAAQLAGLETIPALIKHASDEEVLGLALLENLQREDLNPLEEARAYQRLQSEFRLRQEDVARYVGKDRSSIANALRLLKLPQLLQEDLETGRLTMGHARALLALESEEAQLRLREVILAEGLSVRDTEAQVRKHRRTAPVGRTRPAHLQMLEEALQQHFGTRVSIRSGRKQGKIEITYTGEDDLHRLLTLLQLQYDRLASAANTFVPPHDDAGVN